MRLWSVALVVAAAAVVSPRAAEFGDPPSCRSDDPSELLAAARQAVGAVDLRTFEARGVTRGFTKTASPTTWVRSAIFPDRFLHVETSDRFKFATVGGLNGDVPLFGVRGSSTVLAPRPDELVMQRDAVDRFLLGWFGRTRVSGSPALRFGSRLTYRGEPAILLTRPGAGPALLARLWLSASTCTPLAVGYERTRSPFEEIDPAASAPDLTRVEEVLVDRQWRSGFHLPGRIQFVVGKTVRSEVLVDAVDINGPVPADLFRPEKQK